ncbi:DUF2892 domain-containing protein [Bordetella petrii]|nr:DUF2892 domain-containing protein [Bordetella petrii]
MTLQPISPQTAHRLLTQGAILIDIRSAAEHASERIEQARHVPLDQLSRGALDAGGATVIFHCLSGHRTQVNAAALCAGAGGDAYVLEGGLDAWRKAGLPTLRAAGPRIDVMRQVQIAAGSLVLLGTLLGTAVSPWFHVLPGAVGAGLVLAGLSGYCGLARLLMKMPWNRFAP